MARKRSRMSKKQSSKKFKTGLKTRKENLQQKPKRGGIRL